MIVRFTLYLVCPQLSWVVVHLHNGLWFLLLYVYEEEYYELARAEECELCILLVRHSLANINMCVIQHDD